MCGIEQHDTIPYNGLFDAEPFMSDGGKEEGKWVFTMRIASKIWDSGWGAVWLTLYSLMALHLTVSDNHALKFTAVLPTVFVMFVAEVFSFRIIDFFAGGNLRRSTEEVEQTTGEDHFYHGTDEELQNNIDDFDRRAYQNNISILAGVVIALTAPVIGYLQFSLVGAGGGFVISALSLWMLSRRAIGSLNTLAEDVSIPYETQYENQ